VSLINTLNLKIFKKSILLKFRLNKDFKTLIETIGKRSVPNNKKYVEIEVSGNTKDGIDVVMPSVRYQIS
jgi:hypothetical protein